MQSSNNDKKLPLKSGFEQDVHTGWRHALCYTSRAGVCKKGKRTYNKRHRKFFKQELRRNVDDV